MKKQIFITTFLSLFLFLGSFSSAYAEIGTVPVTQLPSGQRDMYQTDLFTGSASYSYPISVPKGTNDLTPEVSLSYSSLAA